MAPHHHRTVTASRERCVLALASLCPGDTTARADVDDRHPEIDGPLARYAGTATGGVRVVGPWCLDSDDAFAAAWSALASDLEARALAAPFVYDHRAPLRDRYRHEAAIRAAAGPCVAYKLTDVTWSLADSVKLGDGFSMWGRDLDALAEDAGVEVGERREWPDGRAYWTTRERGTPAPDNLAPVRTPAEVLAARRASISAAVGALGWDLHHLDLDHERGRALVELRRDARVVHFRVDECGAKVERFHRATRSEKHLKGGLWWDVPDDRFLGRSSFATLAEGVAALAAYLVDNGNGRALPVAALARALSAGGAR